MKEFSLAPTDAMLAAARQANFYLIMNNYVESIAQSAVVPINVAGMGDESLEAEVRSLSEAYVKHMNAARGVANLWIKDAAASYVSSLDLLRIFADRYADTATVLHIAKARYDAKEQTDRLASEFKNHRKSFDSFQNQLAQARQKFVNDLSAEYKTVDDLSDKAKDLKTEIAKLRKEIGDKVSEVSSKGFDAFVDDAEEAGTAVVELFGGQVGDSIETLAKMAFTTAKFEVEGLVLGSQAIEKLNEVEKLTSELSVVDEAKMLLVFVGERLEDLSHHGNMTSDLIDEAARFFEQASSDIDDLMHGKARFSGDSDTVKQSWHTMANCIHKAQTQANLPFSVLHAQDIKPVPVS